MRTLRTLIALAAVLLMTVALPATVVAQSAGDEQYQDPLGGGGGNSGGGSNGGGSNGGGSNGGGSNGGGSGQASPAQSGTDPAPRADAAQSDQLPRTGFEVILPIYAGIALLLVGVATSRLARRVP
jgi:hypothetical protein